MGRVIFIGAGPGAADLITVRGAQRLSSADVVLFDALTDPALRIYAPKARWIDVGKRGFAAARQPGAPAYDSTKQDAINALIVEHALESDVVVRLKGGDPSIFGRPRGRARGPARRGDRMRGGARRLGGARRRG
jgi:uroporphyrin-III C-methyltransferase